MGEMLDESFGILGAFKDPDGNVLKLMEPKISRPSSDGTDDAQGFSARAHLGWEWRSGAQGRQVLLPSEEAEEGAQPPHALLTGCEVGLVEDPFEGGVDLLQGI